jgi:hypothetical protein
MMHLHGSWTGLTKHHGNAIAYSICCVLVKFLWRFYGSWIDSHNLEDALYLI